MMRSLRRPRWMRGWIPPTAAAAVAAVAILAVVASTSSAGTSPSSQASRAPIAAATATAAISPAAYTQLSATQRVAAASRDFRLNAVPARANYYKYAKNPSASVRARALQRLSNWYTGSPRQAIINQVRNWNPNYSVDIDVSYSTTVVSGYVHADGTITLKVILTMKVTTEGGPVLNKDGSSTTQLNHAHLTVHMKKFSAGYAVIT